jgi:L-serine dehydratase
MQARPGTNEAESLFDWLNVYAMAVNEENAAGGRVVTAPTNGAAGIIPAVLRHYCSCEETGTDKARRFLLTAGGIGLLYKQRASISGAEMGLSGRSRRCLFDGSGRAGRDLGRNPGTGRRCRPKSQWSIIWV